MYVHTHTLPLLFSPLPSSSPHTHTTKDSGKQPEAKKPKKPTVKYIDLPIEGNTYSLVKTLLDRAREKEVRML